MTSQNIPCWKITNCRRSECCLGKNDNGKQCWEVALELDDYRSAMNICRDCIVYISKHDDSVLTETELTVIMEKKGCILTRACPGFQPRPE